MQKNNPLNQNPLSNTYTCNEYREEMILLALKQKLHNSDLSQSERDDLENQIAMLEKKIGF